MCQVLEEIKEVDGLKVLNIDELKSDGIRVLSLKGVVDLDFQDLEEIRGFKFWRIYRLGFGAMNTERC